ncbi:MAG: Fur family transcriptional regulator [Christensenellales bacterium]|jgi:Fur family ferric uptake transcriptional regulator
MSGRKSYNTKQKNLILSCLRENGDRHVTVETIMDYLKNRGETVGQTTVYRNLDKLVRDGAVIKFTAPQGMHACYQYLEPGEHPDCYHLICTSCGHMTHLDCRHINVFTAHMQQEHGFHLDSARTVLYGRCERCNV